MPASVREELLGPAAEEPEAREGVCGVRETEAEAAPMRKALADYSVEQYREAKGRGETDEEIAEGLGISARSLHDWKREHGLTRPRGPRRIARGRKQATERGLHASWSGEVEAGEAARLLRGLGDLAAAVPGRVRVSVEVVKEDANP